MEEVIKELVEIKDILLRLLEIKLFENKINYKCSNNKKGCTKSQN